MRLLLGESVRVFVRGKNVLCDGRTRHEEKMNRETVFGFLCSHRKYTKEIKKVRSNKILSKLDTT